MYTSIITHWPGGWISQTQVENDNNTLLHVSLVSEDQIEHLRKSFLNLQMLCITTLKTLLIKSLSNPSVSLRVYTA